MLGASGRTRGRPRKVPVATASTANLNSFARVSKQTPALGKDLSDTVTPITPSARKRKAARSPEPEEATPTPTPTPAQRNILSGTTTCKSTKKARLQASDPARETPSTPRARSTKKRALSPSLEESPRTREAGNLFKRLRIDASPSAAAAAAARRPSPLVLSSSSSSTTRTSTPATSVVPDSEEDDDDDDEKTGTSARTHPARDDVAPLPRGLLDLVALYAALLKTVALHHAHNGANPPVDLRHISPAVSLAWGKRRISVADVRRCVGVMDAASPFDIVDYGSKKVCLEMRAAQQGRPLDERGLVGTFEGNLRALWDKVRDAEEDINKIILGLPKAAVQSCESLAKASLLLEKGKRAMQDLKAGIAAKKDEQEAVKASVAGADGAKLSLLERLRRKEAHVANLAAAGPTAAELERRAALQRADDVAAVVAMLAKASSSTGMGGRVSFTMATLLQKLKDSLRLPISKEEGASCIRLLAGEVAPEWLRIITIGGKENVVITMGMAPSSGVVVERVKKLSG